MPYNEREFKETNVNYINKDFDSIKGNLIQYAKAYFPSSYKDFNETSPGMMLIEMSAYVGDVLSFYIDQQYKEMMLPLAQERRNINNISKMLGYKPKSIVPAFVTLTVTQTVDADTGDKSIPNYSQQAVIDKGMQVTSTADSNIIFETLDIVDFTISGSGTGALVPVQSATDSDTGLATTYDLSRQITAVSGETKTKTFSVGAPSKFLDIQLTETNIIEIVSVFDSNGNRWYEVDYLAQDKVPKETHYKSDENRLKAYSIIGNEDDSLNLPVPYTLQFLKTGKKFIVETNDDNTTSIIFGNGIARNGQDYLSSFLQTEQVGFIIPGDPQGLVDALDPLSGDDYSSLGETPSQTTLTVNYRVGGGITANVTAGDLSTIKSYTELDGSTPTLSVTNSVPAAGGASQETIEEIRHKARANFTTQNRCVTKEDYEARALAMPAKFGNIAKVICERSNFSSGTPPESPDDSTDVPDIGTSTIDLFTLSYNNNKNLIQTPTDIVLNNNLKNYLEEFRLLTDVVSLRQGFIVNFGVVFEVMAHMHANKQEVKLNCIQKIIDYFNIDKMQFRQPIYISQLEYELMSVDGVRGVNYVRITQDQAYHNLILVGATFSPGLYTKVYNSADGQGTWVDDLTNGQVGYGYKFNFENAYSNGVYKPAVTPAVFELKNPTTNIKGKVL